MGSTGREQGRRFGLCTGKRIGSAAPEAGRLYSMPTECLAATSGNLILLTRCRAGRTPHLCAKVELLSSAAQQALPAAGGTLEAEFLAIKALRRQREQGVGCAGQAPGCAASRES